LITAAVTDTGGKTGSASVSITVGDPPVEATEVGVVEVTFVTEGGKSGDKHLNVTYLVQARISQIDQIGDWRSLETLQYAAYYTDINGVYALQYTHDHRY